MEVLVRVATSADAPRLSALLDELGYAVAPDDVRVEMSQPGTHILVAEDSAHIVGLLAMNTRRHLQRAALVSSIDALVVETSHRQQGVGEALIQAALRAAEESGATIIDLNSSVERVDARRFYERLGFEVVSHHFQRSIPHQ